MPARCCAASPPPPRPRSSSSDREHRRRCRCGRPAARRSPPWWRSAVIYQIYVRSFADADGDGMGDLPGIRSRLPYLRQLGIDAVWLTPFYPSPQADAGYDVADYRDVDPRFGTLADFDGMVADAHALGIRVIVDIVPNHTSSAHPWFQAALASAPGSRERARYLFRDGRGTDGDEPPNDWKSSFGGSAWTRVTEADGRPGQWYLHLFDAGQPDLDWMNDEVRAEFESILRFWFDRGVDGFRIDVAHGLAKDPEMPDLAGRFRPGRRPAGIPTGTRTRSTTCTGRGGGSATPTPTSGSSSARSGCTRPSRSPATCGPDELHTAFNFHFLLAPWDATAMRAAIDASMGALVDGRRPADVGAVQPRRRPPRDALRRRRAGRRRARAAALLMFALPGRRLRVPGRGARPGGGRGPARRGAPGPDVPPHAAAQRKGRDGCRVPIPWGGDEPPFDFGPGTDGVAAAAGRVGGADGRRRGRRPGLDARAVPARPGPAPPAAGPRRRRRWRGSTSRRGSWPSAASPGSCASSTSATSRPPSPRPPRRGGPAVQRAAHRLRPAPPRRRRLAPRPPDCRTSEGQPRIRGAGRCSPLGFVGVGGEEGVDDLDRRRRIRPSCPVSRMPRASTLASFQRRAPTCRLGVGAQRGAHARHLVGGHRHAGAGPAPHQAPVGGAVGDGRRDVPADVRPGLPVGERHDLVPGGGEVTLDGLGHRRDLVGADGDAHVSSARPTPTAAGAADQRSGLSSTRCSTTRPSTASTRTRPRRIGGSSTE